MSDSLRDGEYCTRHLITIFVFVMLITQYMFLFIKSDSQVKTHSLIKYIRSAQYSASPLLS